MCVDCGKLWISGDNLIFDELGGNERIVGEEYFGLWGDELGRIG